MQFVWQPYGDPTINGLIPDDIQIDRPIWSTVGPLICFEVIEWHPTDRVMRQFGLFQHVPVEPRSLAGSHNIDLRGKGQIDWRSRHIDWVTLWDHRHERILQGQLATDYQPSNEYWTWYLQHAAPLRLSARMEQPPPQQQEEYMGQPPPQQHEGYMGQPPPQQEEEYMVQVSMLLPPPSPQPNEDFYWDPQEQQFRWTQHPTQEQLPQQQSHLDTQTQQPPQMQHVNPMEPSRMSLNARDIRPSQRNSLSRGRRSVDSSSGIQVQSGVAGNFGVAFADTAQGDVAESSQSRDLDLSLSLPGRDNVYRPQMVTPEHHPQMVTQEHRPQMTPPDMMTPDFLNISQSVFSTDQWTTSLLQWAMTEDAPASSQLPQQEGQGNEGVGDEGVRDQGVGDEGAGDQGVGDHSMVGEGGRRRTVRQRMVGYLREHVFPPSRWSPSLIRKRRGR